MGKSSHDASVGVCHPPPWSRWPTTSITLMLTFSKRSSIASYILSQNPAQTIIPGKKWWTTIKSTSIQSSTKTTHSLRLKSKVVSTRQTSKLTKHLSLLSLTSKSNLRRGGKYGISLTSKSTFKRTINQMPLMTTKKTTRRNWKKTLKYLKLSAPTFRIDGRTWEMCARASFSILSWRKRK